MNRIKFFASFSSLMPLACSKPVAEPGASVMRLLFAFGFLMTQTGCGAIANRAVPPPWLVGSECSQVSTEVEEQTFTINVVMSILAGAVVFSGGQCDDPDCSGYEGIVELAIGVTALGAGFMYTANEREIGRDNANNCVEYMKTLETRFDRALPEGTSATDVKSRLQEVSSEPSHSEVQKEP